LKGDIYNDLQLDKKKGHWIWCMFPNNKAGSSGGKNIRINDEQIHEFSLIVNNTEWDEWIQYHNYLLDKPKRFFPYIDIGRIEHFANMYTSMDETSRLKPIAEEWKRKADSNLLF
jgi:hypothetical protein